MGMPRPMKAYDSFDAFLKDQHRANASVIRALRKMVKAEAPGLVETVKWGNGCWTGPSGPVAYAHCEPDHVQFGFFAGTSLKDDARLLQGRGKFVRFVKMRKPAEANAAAVKSFLREAAAVP